MSFTGSNVETILKTLIDDFDSTTWSSTNILPFLNEAVMDMYVNHPETRLQSDGTLRTYADLAAIGNTVNLDDQYKVACAEYLAWRYFNADGGDTRDSLRAADHKAIYESYFGGGGGPSGKR